MESVICCCKYYRTNVLRIALRHLQIPLICRSSHELDASDKFGYRINQFYLCRHAYSVVLPIRYISCRNFEKITDWTFSFRKIGKYTRIWDGFCFGLFTPVLPLCRLLSYDSLNRPGKHCNTNSWFVGIAFVRHKSIIYLQIVH